MATKNHSPRNPSAPQEPPKTRPAHEIRLGRIRATIWPNQAENGTWYNVTVSRTYRDGDEWKSSPSFGRDDLLLVAKVADLAHTWICQQVQQRPADGGEQEQEEIPY